MSEYTPGPWEILEWVGDYEKPMMQIRGELEHCSSQVCKMSADGFEEMSPRNIADLKLISAAPDMLSALKRMVNQFESFMETGIAATPEESKSIHEQMTAAIAKAEGAENGG